VSCGGRSDGEIEVELCGRERLAADQVVLATG